jgi:hypothetical protein
MRRAAVTGLHRKGLATLALLVATFPYVSLAQLVGDESPLGTDEVETHEAPSQVETDAAQPEEPGTNIAEVLVSGEQPGPGLWRVVKNGHELWVLGTHSPLPKKMTWRSKQVEQVIAESQEVLTAGGVDAKPNIGVVRGLFLLPAAYAAAKNPDGAKLVDVVPPDAYAHWTVLKQRYMGRDSGIEKWRPTLALLQLRSKAREKSGFRGGSIVWNEVRKLARKHRVPITSTSVVQEIRIEEPRKRLKQFAKVQFTDVDCFVSAIGTMESELESMRLRANAWATGDLATLRSLSERDRTIDCAMVLGEALLSGEISPDADTTEMLKKIQADMLQAQADADEKWFATAKASLAKNTSTFALLPISKLIADNGPLQRLRAEGYNVEEPIE